MVGMKYIASVSFGKDSLAMMLRLIEEKYPLDAVVFYDTGMEFQAIYNIRDKAVKLLRSHNISYVELHPEEPFLYSMLKREVKYKNKDGIHYGYGWCGGTCRWHTSMKLRAIKKYKQSLNDDVTDYVGIAFDEEHRFKKAKQEGKCLPLVSWKMKEQDCLQYCRNRGWNWIENGIDLYDILDRVSCWCCKNKNINELRNIYHQMPQYWEGLRCLQEKIAAPLKGNSGSVFDLEHRFEMEKEWLLAGQKINSKEFYKALRKELI